MKNSILIKLKMCLRLCVSTLMLFALTFNMIAQTETPPKPSAPKTVTIPAVKEKKLRNGLTVAVVERKNVPLVTVQLLIPSGASLEDTGKAGLANMSAALLTKGTKTRTATQIAEQMEFLGGSIFTGAGWNSSNVIVNVMSDKLPQALAIMSDVVLNPTFKQKEIDLLKAQTLDNLKNNLESPGFLANYVASKYSFGEHPAGGTPASVNGMTRDDIVEFYELAFGPRDAVLIFTGDIRAATANTLAQRFFGRFGSQKKEIVQNIMESPLPTANTVNTNSRDSKESMVKRILVVDLPDSGQAAVKYLKQIGTGRVDGDVTSSIYYPALVMNSVLGGGYSARLNQEIRIKRGLSYGAGSSFGWRWDATNFATSTQTKNESAAEVVGLVLAEVEKLAENPISEGELNPRKLVLTGDFGRDLETTQGLAAALADLYSFDIRTSELNSYMTSVRSVSDAQIRDFARQNLFGGDVIVVGDAKIFMDDLKKRFPKIRIETVKADAVDINTLQ